MVNSAILEVIVGMIFVFSLLSILATQINTIIANIINLRSAQLKAGIRDMITDPATRAKFLTHPLICLVRRPLDTSKEVTPAEAARVAEASATDITYIDPRIFSDVLMNLIAEQSDSERNLYLPLQRVANAVLNNAEKAQVNALIRNLQANGVGFDELRTLILELNDEADKQAMLTAFNQVEMEVQRFLTDQGELVAVLRGIQKIDNPDFKKAMETLMLGVRSLDEAQARIERWFNNGMDRVTDLYRRNIQLISLMVGAILAVSLNVDSLYLARTLWNDPALRQTVVESAQDALDTGALAAQVEVTDQDGTSTATGNRPAAAGSSAQNATEVTERELAGAQDKIDQGIQAAQTTLENLLDLRLPIGWSFAAVTGERVNPLDPDPFQDARNLWNFMPWNNPSNWFLLLVMKIAGLILTTIAISQGAPFWFDLLKRVTKGGLLGGSRDVRISVVGATGGSSTSTAEAPPPSALPWG